VSVGDGATFGEFSLPYWVLDFGWRHENEHRQARAFGFFTLDSDHPLPARRLVAH